MTLPGHVQWSGVPCPLTCQEKAQFKEIWRFGVYSILSKAGSARAFPICRMPTDPKLAVVSPPMSRATSFAHELAQKRQPKNDELGPYKTGESLPAAVHSAPGAPSKATKMKTAAMNIPDSVSRFPQRRLLRALDIFLQALQEILYISSGQQFSGSTIENPSSRVFRGLFPVVKLRPVPAVSERDEALLHPSGRTIAPRRQEQSCHGRPCKDRSVAAERRRVLWRHQVTCSVSRW